MICHLYTVPYRARYYHGIMLACKFCMHLQAAKSVSSILWPIQLPIQFNCKLLILRQ